MNNNNNNNNNDSEIIDLMLFVASCALSHPPLPKSLTYFPLPHPHIHTYTPPSSQQVQQHPPTIKLSSKYINNLIV